MINNSNMGEKEWCKFSSEFEDGVLSLINKFVSGKMLNHNCIERNMLIITTLFIVAVRGWIHKIPSGSQEEVEKHLKGLVENTVGSVVEEMRIGAESIGEA